ncbi:VOC family protein [Paracoccus cavernae]|uniref:VOC family protein n=1 Tax=Paracoccus cavernae TaxID=1571207 RepID=A0ABT8D643_9RHOB|nr:VOC family protein [Paracoccus cavernae]
MPRQRVTLITLATRDMTRARILRGLGLGDASSSNDAVTFYQMDGAALGLFGHDDLAADQGRAGASLGTGAVTLAQNCRDDGETDAVFDAALAAGATLLKRPEKVFWGGYSGYFADPDGHVWEIATNPFWPLDDKGGLTLA